MQMINIKPQHYARRSYLLTFNEAVEEVMSFGAGERPRPQCPGRGEADPGGRAAASLTGQR